MSTFGSLPFFVHDTACAAAFRFAAEADGSGAEDGSTALACFKVYRSGVNIIIS